MNWRSVSKRYPLATQSFNGWVDNKGSTRGYNKLFRVPSVAHLPWEFQHGVVLSFLEEQGYLIEPVFNSGGFATMRLYEKRRSGRFIVFCRINNDSREGPVQTSILLQQAILSCLKRIEERAIKALQPPPEQEEEESDFIGVDMKELAASDESASEGS